MLLKKVKTLRPDEKLLLLTCASPETAAVAKCFHPVGEPALVVGGQQPYRYLGKHGQHHVFTVVAPDLGPQEAQSTVQLAFQDLDPRTVVAVGIAFGVDDGKQQIGDVLVSKSVQGYEIARIEPDGRITPREPPHITPRAPRLHFLDRERYGCPPGWPAEAWPRIVPGVMLSGGKLIDNVDFRNSLLALWPTGVVGGEMEAIGVVAAAQADQGKRDWIIVKAICDWADGHKNHADKDARQRLAAWNAALLVKAVYDPNGLASLSPPTDLRPKAAPVVLPANAPQDAVHSDPPPIGFSACQSMLIQAIEAFTNITQAERDGFLRGWCEPLRSVHDALAVLSRDGAVPFLGRIQDTVKRAYPPQANGKGFAPPAVVALVYRLTLVGLEQRVRDRYSPAAHSPSPGGPALRVAVDPQKVEVGAVAAALWLDTGVALEIDTDTGGFRMANAITDAQPVEFGHLSLDDALRAEAWVVSSSRLLDRPRDQWARQRAGLDLDDIPADDVVADYVGRLQQSQGAKLVVALDSRRHASKASDASFHRAMLQRFGLHCYAAVPLEAGDQSASKLQADLLNYLNHIVSVLHPAGPSSAPAA